MGLRINTNVAALIGQRNIERTDRALSTALERMSSGLRINRAADDPSGLAVAERQRAQIAGLNQAIENAERATSLVQTAEGALDEANSILVHMRELAVDAANVGVNDTAALAADQAEIDNALDTLDRIARDTEFGTKQLLDGSAANRVTFADGTNDTIYADISNSTLSTGSYSLQLSSVTDASWAAENATTRTNMGITGNLGTDDQDVTGLEAGQHVVKVTQASTASTITGDVTFEDMGGPQYFKLNVATASGTTGETEITVAQKDYSGVADIETATGGSSMLEDINQDITDAGLDGVVEAYAVDADTIGFRTLSQGSDTSVTVTSGTTGTDALDGHVLSGFTSGDASGSEGTQGTDAIVELDGNSNTVSFIEGDTGLDETIVTLSDGDDGQLKFEADYAAGDSDGLDVGNMVVTVSAATGTATLYNDVSGSGGTGTAGESVSFTAGTAFEISEYGTGGGSMSVTLGDQMKLDGDGSGSAYEDLTVVDNSLEFQVGGGRNQTVSLSLLDVGSDTLAENVTNTSGFSNLSELDVTSAQGAADAILLIDEAIEEVTDVRANMGSFQANTLESQLNNLRVAAENMTSARSTIVDADFAEEVSQFTKQQILMQSGISTLSSAGQLPQLVLSLLGG
ncbi:MAG: flagellin [Planctomycetota bacterium]